MSSSCLNHPSMFFEDMKIPYKSMLLLALMSLQSLPISAQSFFHRIDSTLAARYYRKTGFDTTYISRPMTKWTITARANVSGAKIESEGMDQGDSSVSSKWKRIWISR